MNNSTDVKLSNSDLNEFRILLKINIHGTKYVYSWK